MEQIKKLWPRIRRALYSRVLAAVLMGAVTVSMALGVAVNSRAVTVTDGDKSQVVFTMQDDPYRVLSAAGVTLEEHDALYIDTVQDTIDVARAMSVEVRADGLSTLIHLTSGTVADALNKAAVTVGKQDTVNVDLKQPIQDGLLVQVDRVAYEEYTVTETIDYDTTTRYTFVLSPGRTKVLTAGVEGKRTITYRKTIVNGEVSETVKVKESVTKKPTTQVLIKGSDYGVPYSKAPFSIKLDSKNQPVNFKKKFSGSCTAYATGTIGASGRRLGVGTVAVNPKQIPYGSKLWITSADGKYVYGYAIAADTGGFAKRGSALIDVYMGSYSEACYFGRRNLNVYVLE